MAYTHDELKNLLGKEIRNCPTLYKQKFVNWIGKTKDDPKEKYSEVIAKYLLDGEILRNWLGGITEVPRIANYIVEDHTGEDIKKNSNRHEENLCKQMYLERTYIPELGHVIDYQTPLKNEQKDEAGKIDLLVWNKQDDIVNLVELKHGENDKEGNKETLLRAILELATYQKQINKGKLLDDIKNSERIKSRYGVVDAEKIGACVIATDGCNAYDEMGSDDFKEVKFLAKTLGVDLLRFDIGNQITLKKPNK